MNPFRLVSSAPYLALLLLAIALRILLGASSPTPHGYVYDFYSAAIKPITELGRLPVAEDCFVCYHPPLFPILGGAVFKLTGLFGASYNAQHYYFASLLGVISVLFSVYGYGIYRLYHDNAANLAVWALILFLPVAFISSFSVEADMLSATLVVMAIFYFDHYRRSFSVKALALTAVFAGLAALTKYNGLVICVIVGGFLLYDYAKHRTRVFLRRGLMFALICAVVGGYPYLANLAKYGTPFKGNEAWHTEHYLTEVYSFTDFDLKAAVAVMKDDSPGGMLSEFPAYNNSFFTSIYTQLWTDFSFFSRPGRHGHPFGWQIYPKKDIPIHLVRVILLLGLIPCLLSLVGLVTMLRFNHAPFLMWTTALTMIVYIEWLLGFHLWMLKTKYLLYLVPVWLVMIGYSKTLLSDRVIAAALLPITIASLVYCAFFALA